MEKPCDAAIIQDIIQYRKTIHWKSKPFPNGFREAFFPRPQAKKIFRRTGGEIFLLYLGEKSLCHILPQWTDHFNVDSNRCIRNCADTICIGMGKIELHARPIPQVVFPEQSWKELHRAVYLACSRRRPLPCGKRFFHRPVYHWKCIPWFPCK